MACAQSKLKREDESSMKLKFTKMQGAGNDFVVLDCTRAAPTLSKADYAKLGDRHFGVGCDQILVITAPKDAANDFAYRIFNNDGDEVEHCGNGARCFMRFVRSQGLTTKNDVRVEVAGGVMILHENADETVTVDMGVPKSAVTLHTLPASSLLPASPLLAVFGGDVRFAEVSMGNPHAVLRVEENCDMSSLVMKTRVETQGRVLELHPHFPNRVNVGFMQVKSSQHIALRVWERGAGETLACGTGACAAVVCGIAQGWLQSPVRVDALGGTLTVAWAGQDNSHVFMTGPAVVVYAGEIEI